MDRRTIRIGVVALLCIVAIAAAAATLTSTQQYSPGEGTGPGDGPGSGANGSVDRDTVTPTADRSDPGRGPRTILGVCFEVLRTTAAKLVLLGAALVVLGITVYQYNWWVAAALSISFGPLLVALYAFLTMCNRQRRLNPESGSASNTSLGSTPSAASGGGGGTTVSTEPSVLVLAMLGVLLLVALVAIFANTDDESVDLDERDWEGDAEETAPEAIGRIAGETADRIDEAGDVDNEVFRAWREMVEQLEVDNPDATTPGEFAAAATDAGMRRADVRELTEVFEAVRYGGADPTADREDRAVDALRRIEREYAGEDR